MRSEKWCGAYYMANRSARYTFTDNGYFYGEAYAQNYDVNNGHAENKGTAYIYASIYDENDNEVYVIAEASGIGGAGNAANKVFMYVQKGWYAKVNSATYGGSARMARIYGEAIYLEY